MKDEFRWVRIFKIYRKHKYRLARVISVRMTFVNIMSLIKRYYEKFPNVPSNQYDFLIIDFGNRYKKLSLNQVFAKKFILTELYEML